MSVSATFRENLAAARTSSARLVVLRACSTASFAALKIGPSLRFIAQATTHPSCTGCASQQLGSRFQVARRGVPERGSIATRRYLLRDAVLRVIRLHAGMPLDALEMGDELGRDAIGQIGWNVVELPGPEVADPNEDLEVGDAEPTAGEVLTAAGLEALLKAREKERDRAVGERLALRCLLVFGQAEGGGDFAGDVFDGLHRLVAQRSLPWIGWVEVRQLADVAVDAVRLGDGCAVDLEHGQASKWSTRLAARPIGPGHAIILEWDTGERERKARRFSASAVDIEIGQLELRHG